MAVMELRINGRVCRSVAEARKVASATFCDFLESWLDGRDYVIGHTSGSTGKPKEIHLKKSDMVQSARRTNEFFSLGRGSRFLLCLSPGYIAGKMMIVRAIEAGAEIVEEKPSNRPLDGYEGLPFDFVAVVPSQAKHLAEHPEKWRYVKTVIVGGGAVPDSLRLAIAGSGIDAYSTYGMTETCSHVALARITETPQPFRALPRMTFSTDDRGCLVIDAPQMSFRRLVTNDMVELVDSYSFYWKGRYDNVINTGGIKVFPEELERLAAPLLGCRFYMSSRPSEKWGEEVVLVLEKQSLAEEEKRLLMQRLKQVLPTYGVPKDVIVVSGFKETSSGKIIRERRVK